MSFDEIIEFVSSWLKMFGGVIDYFTVSVDDVAGVVGEIVLPDYILNMSILSLMLNAGFSIFIGVTFTKWILSIIRG